MIGTSYERLLKMAMPVMLAVAVLCLSLSWVSMPSWNVILKAMSAAGKNDATDMFMSWVRTLSSWYNVIPDIPKVTQQGTFYDVINAIIGVYNLFWKLSVGFFFIMGILISYIGYTLSFVVPALTQFASLFGESIGTSFGHVGNVSHIDWESMSGDFGYIDPVIISLS